jgi:hypothetical protein
MLIIAAMVAAVFFLSLPGTTVWRKVLQDAGHGPVFAVVGIVLALMRAPPVGESARSPAMYLRAFAIAVAIGVATELIQYFQPGRNVSLIDVLHDAAGAAFGLALLVVAERRRPSPGLPPTSPASAGEVDEPSLGVPPTSPASAGEVREPSPAQQRERVGAAGVRALSIMIALAAFAILAWQPLQAARAYAARAAAFPTLADGEAQPGDTFLAGRNALLDRRPLPARWARPGDRASLHLRFERASLPAFDLFEPSPDWRGYSTLALDVTNPGPAPLRFTLRIHDEQHDWSNDDRLNLPIVVPPGVRTTIRVSLAAVESAPRSRRMDLSRIADVMLFSRSPAAGTEFYVSRAWLE